MKIKNEFSSLWAEIDDKTGWVTLWADKERIISLGKYPNAIFRVLEELLKKLKEKNEDNKKV